MLAAVACVVFAGRAFAGAPWVTLTGWFACDKCTAERVAKGEIRPSNPVCSRQCIEKGDEPVFLSEQGKESLKVRKYGAAVEDLGYHVEVRGIIDREAGTIAIHDVKRLSRNGAACARPGAVKK